MKNTKIMAALVIFLAAALFIGAASATEVTVSNTQSNPSVITTAGNYTLVYDNATIPGHYLPAGTTEFGTFGTLSPVSGNYTFAAANNGNYQQIVSTAEVTYQLNYVQNASDANQNFVKVSDNVYQRNITANTVATLRFPDTTFIPMGTAFTDGNITQAVTDNAGTFPGYEAETVLKYTIPASSVTYYLSIDIGSTPVPTGADRNVATGNDAFVFEHITVNNTDGPGLKLTKFTDGSSPSVVNQISADANGVFYLTEEVVGNNYGTYYLTSTWNPNAPYVNIWYPELSLKAELTTNDATGATAGDSIDGKTVNKDTVVSFLISAPKVGPAYYDQDNVTGATAKIVFTTPVSGKTTAFGGESFSPVLLTGSQTLAGFTSAGTDATAGAWTAQAEYVSPEYFADYAEKSNTISFTLKSTTLSITADKDSVVRSNPFTVTISGDSKTDYAVFIENYDKSDVNPSILANQSGWQKNTQYDNNGNVVGAVFETDAAGARTVQFNTASDTDDQTYTIRVEKVSDRSDYDKVDVKVVKGAITLSASGDGSYYIGEEIKLTGTNTDSDNVFLFVTGPNLDFADGVVLKDLGGTNGQQNAAYTASNPVSVNTDDTWEYKWDTKLISLDAGAYTVYATSRLTNGKSSGAALITEDTNSKYDEYGTLIDGSYYAVKLSDSEYATVSINLKKPFLSAVPSGTVVAKGDKIYIRGTAEGDPSYLQLYIFGPNFYKRDTITVEDDGTYEKKIEVGSDWASNQYYVVIEHPMENGAIDVDEWKENGKTILCIPNADGLYSPQSSFVVDGSGKLQSANAANALTTMIDNANIDDVYTKLTFTVAEPSITITNPGDQGVGTTFTISGKTNLAVDDQILVEVVSSSFNPVDKTQSSSTSGVSMTTKVVAGDGVENTWSVEVDTTNWKLDEYTIKATGIEVDVTATTNFNLVEKTVVTPTATATGATPTTTATATATTAPTQTPGFGAFVALAGLGAVALLVLRRN